MFASRVPVLRCSGVSVPVSFLFRCVGPVSVYRACLLVVFFSCATLPGVRASCLILLYSHIWFLASLRNQWRTCLIPAFASPLTFLFSFYTVAVLYASLYLTWTNVIVFASLSPSPVPRNHLGSPTSPVSCISCIAPYRWICRVSGCRLISIISSRPWNNRGYRFLHRCII